MEPTPTPRIKSISISDISKKQELTKQELAMQEPAKQELPFRKKENITISQTIEDLKKPMFAASELRYLKKTRKRVLKFDTTYCFNLSKSQLTALTEYAKFHNVSISKSIRNAITEMMNKGRI